MTGRRAGVKLDPRIESERRSARRWEIDLLVEGLKFKRPLLPGQRATLTLEADPSLERFRFCLAKGEEVFSLGRLDCSSGGEGGA